MLSISATLALALLAVAADKPTTAPQVQSSSNAADAPDQRSVFVSGQDGYHTYRIPAVIVTPKGTVLAFCEGRKSNRSDTGNIDLLLKRSTDGGRTFSPQQVVWDDGDNTCGNPCPVIDRKTGTIWLLLTHNLGEDRESEIIGRTSKGSRTVWINKSTDDGVTWSKPVEITATTKKPSWTWYATGPGVGIQLKSGRLVIPCDCVEAGTKRFYSRHLATTGVRHQLVLTDGRPLEHAELQPRAHSARYRHQFRRWANVVEDPLRQNARRADLPGEHSSLRRPRYPLLQPGPAATK